MERPSPILLRDAVAQDFPGYSEIALSFPDQWELLRELRTGIVPLYIAGLPTIDEPSRSGNFPRLPLEINQTLTRYRHYKTFEPWPQPQLLIGWNEQMSSGRVLNQIGVTVQLQPTGQAQAWFGGAYAVIWECHFFHNRLRPNWTTELIAFWEAVEADTQAQTFFTEAIEPDFPEGEFEYTDFLTSVGYQPIHHTSRWWRKSL